MTVTWCGRGLLKRVREVIVVKGQLTNPYLPNTPPTCPSLIASLYSQTRNYTSQLPLSHQSCLATRLFLTCPSPAVTCTSFSTSPVAFKIRPKVDSGSSGDERPRNALQQIMLIDDEDKVSTMTLEAATKLARRQDLKLVKIEDPSQGRGSQVYKLLTGKQYFEHQMKAKSEKKSNTSEKADKNLVIRGKISEHDLEIKLHNMIKWLGKGHRIKVSITSAKATQEDVEKVFSTIEEEVKKIKGRILQRHEKMNEIRFYIAPLKEEKEKTNKKTKQEDTQIQDEESDHHTKE